MDGESRFWKPRQRKEPHMESRRCKLSVTRSLACSALGAVFAGPKRPGSQSHCCYDSYKVSVFCVDWSIRRTTGTERGLRVTEARNCRMMCLCLAKGSLSHDGRGTAPLPRAEESVVPLTDDVVQGSGVGAGSCHRDLRVRPATGLHSAERPKPKGRRRWRRHTMVT